MSRLQWIRLYRKNGDKMKTLLRQTIWLASLFLTLSFWRTTLSENKIFDFLRFQFFKNFQNFRSVRGCLVVIFSLKWNPGWWLILSRNFVFEIRVKFLFYEIDSKSYVFRISCQVVGAMNRTVDPCMIVWKLKNFIWIISLWKKSKKMTYSVFFENE